MPKSTCRQCFPEFWLWSGGAERVLDLELVGQLDAPHLAELLPALAGLGALNKRGAVRNYGLPVHLADTYGVSHTVCPRSSDPPEKIFQYICIRKFGLHRFLTLTVFRLKTIRIQSKLILGHLKYI